MTQIATPKANRIVSLDVLRGFALLGIFVMNMISFAMVGSNYLNPMAEGVLTGADAWAYEFTQLFANTKFMSLFSILFGAGVVLFTDRLKVKGLSEAKWHFRRNFWLLLIGMAHGYLLWSGDILVSYALCSIWVFLFRNWSVRWLLILAALFYSVEIGGSLLSGWSMPYWEASEVAELCEMWNPSQEYINDEIAAMTGSWMDQMPYRVENTIAMQTFVFLMIMSWKITAMMLLGMALYKSGVITGEKSKSFYKKLRFFGFFIGLGFVAFGMNKNAIHDYACEYSFFQGTIFNSIGSVGVVLMYIGIIMLMLQGSWGPKLEKYLAPVGRMALTNYLMQTIIATTIFFGHGFGLFGTLGRAEHWLVILPVWVFQIAFSKWWMERYKFGPAEWAWRSLTYWNKQEMH